MIIATLICLGFDPLGLLTLLVYDVRYILHALSAQQVSREQSVNWDGAADYPGVVSIWGSPQTGVLWHTAPQQVTSVSTAAVPSTADCLGTSSTPAPEACGVAGSRVAQPRLIGAWCWAGLPAGGGGEGLALCKEAVHIVFTGKLCQDGSVTQHTP